MDINQDNLKELVPYKKITHKDLENIIIGHSFLELAKLGMRGEYLEYPATETCPRLFYCWNEKKSKWFTYALEHDLIFFNTVTSGTVGGNTDGDDKPENPDNPDHPCWHFRITSDL